MLDPWVIDGEHIITPQGENVQCAISFHFQGPCAEDLQRRFYNHASPVLNAIFQGKELEDFGVTPSNKFEKGFIAVEGSTSNQAYCSLELTLNGATLAYPSLYREFIEAIEEAIEAVKEDIQLHPLMNSKELAQHDRDMIAQARKEHREAEAAASSADTAEAYLEDTTELKPRRPGPPQK